MSQKFQLKSKLSSTFTKFVLLSLVLHVGLSVLVVFGPGLASRSIIKDRVIQTKLVQFKKKKPDPKLLPRKPKVLAKKKASKKPKVVPKKKPAQKPKPIPKPSIQDRLSKLTKNFQGLEEVDLQVRDDLSAEMAVNYEQQIQAIIKEAYRIPATLRKDALAVLEVSILLKIGSGGGPLSVSILNSSGNATYDQAVVDGAKGVDSFGAPPLGLRAKYARKGVKVILCPLNCQGK